MGMRSDSPRVAAANEARRASLLNSNKRDSTDFSKLGIKTEQLYNDSPSLLPRKSFVPPSMKVPGRVGDAVSPPVSRPYDAAMFHVAASVAAANHQQQQQQQQHQQQQRHQVENNNSMNSVGCKVSPGGGVGQNPSSAVSMLSQTMEDLMSRYSIHI